MLKYNLQFFADGGEDDGKGTLDNDGTTTNNDDNSTTHEIDATAFADLLSERDKKIEQLESEITSLKKSNAELIVRVNSATTQTPQKSFEENLLNMVGAKPRKE